MLAKEHFQHLREEGFSEQEIDSLVAGGRVRSLSVSKAKAQGYRCWDGEEWRSSSGIEFRFTKSFGQLRADQPISRKRGKSAKYLTPAGKRTQAWIPEGCLAVTEGFKDAAIATLRGIPTGAIAGVSHYRKALPKDCGYTIVFDSDGWVNPQIFANLLKAGLWCGGRVLILPKMPKYPKGGLCELYKTGGALDLGQSIRPLDLLLDWPNHWDGQSGANRTKLSKKAVQLATEYLLELESISFINRIAEQHRDSGIRSRSLMRVRKRALSKIAGEDSTPYQQDYNTILSALGDRLRFNEVTKRFELDGQQFSADEVRPTLEIDLRLKLRSRAKEPLIEIVHKIAKSNSYNPVLEYLSTVYERYKDQPDLLRQTANNLANTYLGTTDPTANILLRKTLIAAISRANQPGCKVDTSTVLVGPQGINKSRFWQTLASLQYFCDDFADPNNKDHLLKLHESWIVEWSELHGLTRREVTQVKQFMATGRDLIRVPYGRSNEWMPRASIIVGTSNEGDFLTDPTGNRRWWVIEVNNIDIEAVRRDRDLIWAAAFHCYQAGELWWADTTLELSLEADRKRYQKQDAWQDTIADYLAGRDRVSVAEIFDCVLATEVSKRTNTDSGRITKILKLEGFISSPNAIRYQYQIPGGRIISSRQRVWERRTNPDENFLNLSSRESAVSGVSGVLEALNPLHSKDPSLTHPRHTPNTPDTPPAQRHTPNTVGVSEGVSEKTHTEKAFQPPDTPNTPNTPVSLERVNKKFSDRPEDSRKGSNPQKKDPKIEERQQSIFEDSGISPGEILFAQQFGSQVEVVEVRSPTNISVRCLSGIYKDKTIAVLASDLIPIDGGGVDESDYEWDPKT